MIEQCVNMTADTLFYMDGVLVTGTLDCAWPVLHCV